MTRNEHMEWSKKRALKYCDVGDPQQAYTSMASDLGKHPETEKHVGIMLGFNLMLIGQLSTPERMREFIEGFN